MGQCRPSYQSRTRSARRVFQRPVAVLELEVGLAPVRVLEQPGAVGLPLVADQPDGLGGACVGGAAGAAEVVQGAQHVVVPAWRPRELQPALGRHLARAPAPEQVPFQEVLLPAAAGCGHGHGSSGQLVLEQALEHADRRVERRHGGAVLCLAVPAAVVELRREQSLDEAVEVRSEAGTAGPLTVGIAQGEQESSPAFPSTRARSAATSSSGAWARSCSTCQRIAGSPSRSQSWTSMAAILVPTTPLVDTQTPPLCCRGRSARPRLTPSLSQEARPEPGVSARRHDRGRSECPVPGGAVSRRSREWLGLLDLPARPAVGRRPPGLRPARELLVHFSAPRRRASG